MNNTVLELHDSKQEIFLKMSEGNPGALVVLAELMTKKTDDEFFRAILNLDSMEIRGCKIWIGYKDYCGQDLDSFCHLALLRDKEMADFIEKEISGG